MKRLALIQARESKGWNQAQVAEMLNISAPHLSDIENRKKNPSLVLALKMALLYGESVEKLFKEDVEQIFLNAC